MADLGRFLNLEISHLQTINDLAGQLQRHIAVQEYRPISEVRQSLEQMLLPQ